jgi:predicted NBD/HSP70 family sugar kinase
VAADLKISNRKTVYRLIRQQGGLSKAEISRITGISPPTVLKIIDYFSSFGLVAETGAGISSVGRRPQLLRAVPDAAYTLGALFDGRRLSLGLVDLAGDVKAVRRSQTIPDLKNLLEIDLPGEALSLIGDQGIHPETVKGIGIGVPCVVDRSSDIVRFAPLAGVHEDFNCAPLLRSLESRLGCPAFLENDANVAALGEHAARGGGTGVDLILVELGRGLGAGIVLDGNLRRGPRCMAGEIGYLVLDPAWKASSDAPGWLANGPRRVLV